KQESYDAGYDSIKAVERGADIYTVFKGGAKLVRKLGKEEASLSKGIKGVEEKNGGKGGAPGLLGDTAKADSALAKAGDGKFKTNALRIPTNFESLGSYLQSVARKMNIRITKRSPILATAGGHYKFHDLGPDVPHSKAGAKVSPERQKQIDALESGEYSGKDNKGTGETAKSVVDKEKWLGGLRNKENFKIGTKENGLNHIFDGEILKNGKANGFHYEGMPNSNGKIVGNVDPPNEFGVYQANIEVSGVLKKVKSTFFPREWSPQQVIDAINEASRNKEVVKNNVYRGVTSRGMEIEFVLRNDKIISAYPLY
ncbi:EndoU domain-containing protein, partial [Paenibacillus sp. NRS-1781]|uniref:EndoU domain-containing protein n=1 Tax=Paenibacillus sp. NRS-1781 TaxID=3233905 RepID=UPI003D2A88BF